MSSNVKLISASHDNMLEDIAILTKGDLISEDLGIKLDNVTLEMLGTCLLYTSDAADE